MLRIRHSTSNRARNYYTHPGRYYSQEIVGDWSGKGARMLGLSGRVDEASFVALCDNINPQTGETLTVRRKAHRRAGYDFNLNCPKTVSIMATVGGDDRILPEVQLAADETMREVERLTYTRVRIGNADEDALTGNFIRASFLHKTTRPEDGYPDPHIHTHEFVFNATWHEQEHRWKALQLGEVKRRAPYFEAVFHARLAARLRRLGYEVVRRGKSWEIAGLSEELIQKMSRRTAKIEAVAAAMGMTDDADRDKLGAMTREAKAYHLTDAQVSEFWASRLTPEDRKAISGALERAKRASRSLGQLREIPQSPTPLSNEKRAVEFALRHCLERESGVPEYRLREMALRFGVGNVDVDRLNAVVDAYPGLIRSEFNGQQYITTKEVLAEEKRMLLWVANGRGTVPALAPNHVIQDDRLSSEQRAAVAHVLNSTERVVAIRGKAGTGKTTTMKEVVAAIENSGQAVFSFAPTAEAARVILRREGFQHAETVASLLVNPTLQEKARGGVWWVDEAGLVSGRTMGKVFELADQLQARIILTGDSGQHAPVERGSALKLLEERGGLAVADITEIRRQDGLYREAVEDMARGNPVDAFRKFDRMNAILEVEDETRYRALAGEYLEAVRSGDTALVISPTHAEIEQVTQAIRAQLKNEGRLKDERDVFRLQRLDLTEAEKGMADSYRPGLVLQFVKPAKGILNGERLEVAAVGESGLVLRNNMGNEMVVDAEQLADRFQVFEKRTISLGIGDRVRVTQNCHSGPYRLYNGGLHTVAGIASDGNIRLDNGMTVHPDFGHWDHGFAMTSHSSQGKNVDWVFVAESSDSLGAASLEQFYVSVSRGRKGARIYTDDREALLEAVMETNRRISAHDLVQEPEEITPLPDRTPTSYDDPVPLRARLGDSSSVAVTEQTRELLRRKNAARQLERHL